MIIRGGCISLLLRGLLTSLSIHVFRSGPEVNSRFLRRRSS